MANGFQERRRAGRTAVDAPLEFRLERTVRVRVLDLSVGGALLWTDDRLPIGSPGRLSVLLGDVCFEGQVTITRDEPARPGSGRHLGAVLTRAHPGHRRWLEEFLRSRGTGTD